MTYEDDLPLESYSKQGFDGRILWKVISFMFNHNDHQENNCIGHSTYVILVKEIGTLCCVGWHCIKLWQKLSQVKLFFTRRPHVYFPLPSALEPPAVLTQG